MQRTALLSALTLTTALATPALAGDGWLTDMDEAMAKAAAEQKLLLIDFTGSDWCGWCIKLDDEVFSQSLFKEEIPEHFVLVELDFPRADDIITAEQREHNQKWADKYQIQGYPTIILADEHGEVFAESGYRPGGPGPYVEHLTALRNGKTVRDAALAGADQLDGLAKAMLLDQALSVEDIKIGNRVDHMRTIIELDPDDVAGLRSKYETLLMDLEVEDKLMAIDRAMRAGDPDEALAVIDAIRNDNDLSADSTLKVNQAQLGILFQDLEFDAMKAIIDESINLDEGDAMLRQQIATMAIQIGLANGDKDAAIAAYDAAVGIDPESEFGKQMSNDREEFISQIDSIIQRFQQFIDMRRGELGGGDGDDASDG